ncbi:putative pyridoxal kinase BUD17 TDEL_0A07490 [Torulaspora delbrueckii]|uniref:pyridoxal kinase n=1 Tax=Torulaspora delbrueckii TaxID=4950 RepID=G8ZN87_TORDE|nr:hypothetical protein TDEL_0A07490 [Torulaspora delbrueckii]CCE90081.1 hypothetical protein TDEL_0A07490 [Torulaspora delbrueckii]
MTKLKEPVEFEEISRPKTRTRRVLSIQSHVVHGYVGNKAATFPLQYRSWDVDALNTVQFSNHPGYGSFSGFRSKAGDIDDILEKGLLNGLHMKYDAVMIGYLPCVESLKITGQRIGALCRQDPQIKWILDPVLGDNGKLYVAEEIVPIYKKILQNSGVFLVTPNQFEMEILTDVKIDSLDALWTSFEQFHQKYPKVDKIVVTSLEFPVSQEHAERYIYSACYDTTATSGRINYFKVPKIDAHFSGSGDLFNALLLDLVLPVDYTESIDLPNTLWTVLLLVDKILRRTLQLSYSQDPSTKSSVVINDLKLIQCQELLDPSCQIEEPFNAIKMPQESIK